MTLIFKSYSQVITVGGILVPSGSNATQARLDELAIGGPSSDWKTIPFPRTGVTNCPGVSSTPTTINQEIDTYGKAILIVISPSDCPYCRNAANAANADIMARINNIRLWYIGSKLAGGTSDCNEIPYMKSQYPFINAAHHFQMDNWWWDNSIGGGHHNTSNSCFWSMPESPSVYRIVDPVSRRVTDLGYYLPVASLDAAIANNFNPNAGLTVTPSGLNFSASSSSLTFTISGSGAWTINNPSAWLTLSTISGSGNRVITLTSSVNTSINSRNSVISVSGSSVRTINISQAGAAPILNVSPSSLSYVSIGSSQNISITGNVNWSISNNAAWISLSTSAGFGNSTISVNSSSNGSTNPRFSVITLSGSSINRLINITQTGAAAALSATSSSINLPSNSNSINISITSNISWSISDDAAWLSLSNSNGTGNSVVSASATNNTSTYSRTANITVSGGSFVQVISVTQTGVSEALVGNPTSINFSAVGGISILTITGNVSWTLNENVNWLSLSAINGLNNSIVTITAINNASINTNNTVLTLSGGSITRLINVSQAASAPILTVNPSNISASATTSTQTITVSSNVNYNIIENSNWISTNVNSGTGSSFFTISIAENTGITARNEIISVTGNGITRTISVSQIGATPILNVSPSSLSYASQGGINNISISGNVAWTVVGVPAWLSVSTLSGNGLGFVAANASANGVSTRSALLTISGSTINRIVNITQNAASAVLTVNPTNMNYSSSTGSQQIVISTNANWISSVNGAWFSLSNNSGSGNSTLTGTASQNMSVNSRTATVLVSVAGGSTQLISITQQGATPSLSISPSSINTGSNGGIFIVTVTSNTNWTLAANNSWINTSTTTGFGSKTLTLTVNPNLLPNQLDGKVSFTYNSLILDLPITISGATPTLNVSTTNLNFSENTEMKQINLTSNLSWSIANTAPWITFSSISGSNNATISVNSIQNTLTSSRTAVFTVSGLGINRLVNVTQAGASPLLTISNTTLNFNFQNQTLSTNITSNLNWHISSSDNWVSYSPSSGNGNQMLDISVNANSLLVPRTATVSISGLGLTRLIKIVQTAFVPTLSVSSSNFNFSSASSSQIVQVSSNTQWQINSSESWISINPQNGSNNGSFEILVSDNQQAVSRTGYVTVSGSGLNSVISVNQNAGSATLQINTSSLSFGNGSEQQSVNISSNINWVVSTTDNWLSLSALSGSMNGAITLSVTSNNTINARIGAVTFSGMGQDQILLVYQSGSVASLSISPQVIDASNLQLTYVVTVSSNLNWNAIETSNWVSLDKISGSGSQTITLSVSANTSTTSRQTLITISGSSISQIITLNQAAGESILEISSSQLTIDQFGGNNQLTITGNVFWSIPNQSSNWISLSTNAGMGLSLVSIIVEENSSAIPRNASISIVGGSQSETFEISQIGAEEVLNTVNTLPDFGWESNSEILEITSNTNWTILGIPDWLTIDPKTGQNSENVIITPLVNQLNTNREVILTLVGYNNSVHLISVKQKSQSTTSISPKLNESISIFPNPIDNKSPLNFSKIVHEASLIALDGTVLKTVNNTDNMTIDNIPSGMYFIKISNQIPQKLIIK